MKLVWFLDLYQPLKYLFGVEKVDTIKGLADSNIHFLFESLIFFLPEIYQGIRAYVAHHE